MRRVLPPGEAQHSFHRLRDQLRSQAQAHRIPFVALLCQPTRRHHSYGYSGVRFGACPTFFLPPTPIGWLTTSKPQSAELTLFTEYGAVRMSWGAIAQINPDLVLLDFQIGNMGGVAACLAVRQEEEAGRLEPSVIYLLLDREADVFLASRAAPDGWLIKPLNPFNTLRTIEKALASLTESR